MFIFHQKTLIPFVNDAKLLKFCSKFYFYFICHEKVHFLRKKNMKGWSVSSEILYVETSGPLLKKLRKQKNSLSTPSW